MARVKMAHAAYSRKTSSHSRTENANTPYNPVKLLKGAPPGQALVSYYSSELQISKNNSKKQDKIFQDHLSDVASNKNFEYHHNLFLGPRDRNTKFYQPDAAAIVIP